MKDSYEKDPFAEYDKYWDDLDKQEEKSKKKSHKAYDFDEQKPKPMNVDQKKLIRSIGIGFAAFFFFGIFINMFASITSGDGTSTFGSWMFPFMMTGSSFTFIFIIIVVMIIYKASKRD